MIFYKSKSIYFDTENGEEISKQLAKRDYIINKPKKHLNTNEITENNGYKYGTITIEWWYYCERKTQIKLQF